MPICLSIFANVYYFYFHLSEMRKLLTSLTSHSSWLASKPYRAMTQIRNPNPNPKQAMIGREFHPNHTSFRIRIFEGIPHIPPDVFWTEVKRWQGLGMKSAKKVQLVKVKTKSKAKAKPVSEKPGLVRAQSASNAGNKIDDMILRENKAQCLKERKVDAAKKKRGAKSVLGMGTEQRKKSMGVRSHSHANSYADSDEYGDDDGGYYEDMESYDDIFEDVDEDEADEDEAEEYDYDSACDFEIDALPKKSRVENSGDGLSMAESSVPGSADAPHCSTSADDPHCSTSADDPHCSTSAVISNSSEPVLQNSVVDFNRLEHDNDNENDNDNDASRLLPIWRGECPVLLNAVELFESKQVLHKSVIQSISQPPANWSFNYLCRSPVIIKIVYLQS